MDYFVGGVSALITGHSTPDRPKLYKRALTPKKHEPSPNVTPKSELDDRSVFLSPSVQRKKAIVKKSPKRIFENPNLEETLDDEGIAPLTSPRADKVKKNFKIELGDNVKVPDASLTKVSPLKRKGNKEKKSSDSPSKISPVKRKKNMDIPESQPENKKSKKKEKNNATVENRSDKENSLEINTEKRHIIDSNIQSSEPIDKKSNKKKFKKAMAQGVEESPTKDSEANDNVNKKKKKNRKRNKNKNKNLETVGNSELKTENKINIKSQEVDSHQDSDNDIESENENNNNETNDNQNKKKNKKRKKNKNKIDKAAETVGNVAKKVDKIKIKKKKSIVTEDSDSEHESDNDIESENERNNKEVLELPAVEDSSDDEPTPKKAKEKTEERKEDGLDVKRTLFVGNVPFSKKCKKEMKKIFSEYGQIETVRIRSVPVKDATMTPKLAVIKNELHPERSTVNVYIKFKDQESVDKACKENNRKIGDNHIRVSRSDSSGGGDPRKAVFIGNMPFKISDDTLRAVFTKCGAIESVRIVRDKKTNAGKGFGFVNFESADGVELALQMSAEELTVEGRELRVKRCSANPGSFQKRNKSSAPPTHRPSAPPQRSSSSAGAQQPPTGAYGRIMKKRQHDGSNGGPPNKRANIAQPHKEKKNRKEFVGTTAAGKKKKQKFNKDQKQKKKLSQILTK